MQGKGARVESQGCSPEGQHADAAEFGFRVAENGPNMLDEGSHMHVEDGRGILGHLAKDESGSIPLRLLAVRTEILERTLDILLDCGRLNGAK